MLERFGEGITIYGEFSQFSLICIIPLDLGDEQRNHVYCAYSGLNSHLFGRFGTDEANELQSMANCENSVDSSLIALDLTFVQPIRGGFGE